MLKPGKFEAKPIGQPEFGLSSGGHNYARVDFKLIDGPNRDEITAAYLYFSDKTAGRSSGVLRYCGAKDFDWPEAKLDGFGSRNVLLDLREETYKGEVRIKVAWVNEIKAPTELPDTDLPF